MSKHAIDDSHKKLASKRWRLNNLYKVVDKNGNSVRFKMNPIQLKLFEGLHSRNLVLKARQMGSSTFSVLYYLDEVIFEENCAVGVVSYGVDHAQYLFKRVIGHAIETLDERIKPLLDIVQYSAREITFGNGSSIRVDTSLRGGSYLHVLVSEFGKTCARYPIKAEEVITGTLQSVPLNGSVIIESTGEGMDGYYAEMCNSAATRGDDVILSELDYKLHFFPWFDENEYQLEQKTDIDTVLTDYFSSLESKHGISLIEQKKWWYASQEKILHDKIKQEYPSTISEAFLASSDAYYFAQLIADAYDDDRCLYTSIYDMLLPVYVAMDIGVNDLTVIVFFQVAHGEVRIIDYYEDSNKGVDHYAKYLLQDKPYHYHTIFLPHDSKKRSILDVQNTYERDLRRLISSTDTRVVVLPRMDKQLSIGNSKHTLRRCVFALKKVKPLLDHMSKYRKTWNESKGMYFEDPYHDIHSNYGDAFQYLSQAVAQLEVSVGPNAALEKHRKVIKDRYKNFIY